MLGNRNVQIYKDESKLSTSLAKHLFPVPEGNQSSAILFCVLECPGLDSMLSAALVREYMLLNHTPKHTDTLQRTPHPQWLTSVRATSATLWHVTIICSHPDRRTFHTSALQCHNDKLTKWERAKSGWSAGN